MHKYIILRLMCPIIIQVSVSLDNFHFNFQVCEQCFNSEQQSLGANRSLMREFRSLRKAHRKHDMHRYV